MRLDAQGLIEAGREAIFKEAEERLNSGQAGVT
jgi:hypothetical protein